jgi:hypothetical protein
MEAMSDCTLCHRPAVPDDPFTGAWYRPGEPVCLVHFGCWMDAYRRGESASPDRRAPAPARASAS